MNKDELRERIIEVVRKKYLYWSGEGTAVCSTLDEEAFVESLADEILKVVSPLSFNSLSEMRRVAVQSKPKADYVFDGEMIYNGDENLNKGGVKMSKSIERRLAVQKKRKKKIMREIKFRAWDKRNRVMLYEFYLSSNVEKDNLRVMAIKYPPWTKVGQSYPDDFILSQYTGLKDKNGKEIYEGDIVKDGKGTPLEVKWNYHHVAFTAGNRWMEWLRGYGNSGNPHHAPQGEVIGNIYENPKLLEVNQ